MSVAKHCGVVVQPLRMAERQQVRVPLLKSDGARSRNLEGEGNEDASEGSEKADESNIATGYYAAIFRETHNYYYPTTGVLVAWV